jgi:tetrahydromethanopterin S-methyltransferase subunit A
MEVVNTEDCCTHKECCAHDTAGTDKLELRKPTIAENARIIAASYETEKEWKQDSVGYWLFRVNIEKNCVEAGFCKEANVIEIVVTGTESEKMHNTIVREGLVTSLQHAAYIGHELQKAEVALKLGLCYVQDKSLELRELKNNPD